jgi:hypothetical protein
MHQALPSIPIIVLLAVAASTANAADAWSCKPAPGWPPSVFRIEGNLLAFPSPDPGMGSSHNTMPIVKNRDDALLAVSDNTAAGYFDMIIIDKRAPSVAMLNMAANGKVFDSLQGPCTKEPAQ